MRDDKKIDGSGQYVDLNIKKRFSLTF